ITGRAEVRAPTEKVRRAAMTLPDIRFSRHEQSRRLLEQAAGGAAVATAVAHPCDLAALRAAVEGAHAGLILPILIGP
ncbi:enoyl-CoA hydratase, partial [Acinetobacter baumannii]